MAKQPKQPKAINPRTDKPEKAKPEASKVELGVTGTHKYGGIISEDYKQQFNGPEAMAIYDEMRKSDATVAAAMAVVKMPIRRAKFFMRPVDEKNAQDVKVADFVKKNLFDVMEITWDDFLRQSLLMLDYGVMVFEKVYDIKDMDGGSFIVLKKLAPRMPRSILEWEIDGEGGQKEFGITQQRLDASSGANPQIPGSKLVIFVNNMEGDNWWGIAALRPAYKHWYIKKSLELIDAMAHERQGLGVPVVKIPDGMNDKDKNTAKTILKNLRADHEGYGIVPKSIDLEFLDMHASSTKEATTSIEYHNRQIMLSVLAQFLMLGSGQNASGSRSTSQDHSRLFLQSIEAVARQVCDTINRYVVPELVDLNFPGTKEYPKLDFAAISPVDIAQLSTAYKTLVDAGALRPIEGDERTMRSTMQLPERTPEDDARELAKQKEEEAKAKMQTDQEIAKAVAIAAAKGNDGTAEVVPKAKQKDVPVKASELPFDEHYFNELSGMVDNRLIVGLHNEFRDSETRETLKKKGLRFNSFEDNAARPLTFAERKVDLEGLQAAISKFEAQLEEKITDITSRQKEDLLKQVKKAVEDNDINALDGVKTKYKAELAAAITEVQKQMFEVGKKGAAIEMGVEAPSTAREVQGAMRVQANNIVDRITNDLENDAKQAASETISRRGGAITSTGAAEAVSAASTLLDKRVEGAKRAINAIATTGSVNMGRGSVFTRYPEKVYAMQYSAILDLRTTDHCRSLDGRIVKPGSAEYYNYAPPQHHNCRSMWVEILNDELFKPEITGIPSTIHPSSSVGDYQKLKSPELLAGSPAIGLVKQELEDRRAKLKELTDTGKFPNRQEQHKARIAQLEKALKKAGETFKEEIIAMIKDGR